MDNHQQNHTALCDISQEKDYLLLDEEGSPQEDLAVDQERWRQKVWALVHGSQLPNQHPSYCLRPTLFCLYFASIHVLCFLLASSIIWQSTKSSHKLDIKILDFNNRYPDWIPIVYELRAKYALENPQSEFTGMPNDENTKAWDELIAPTYFSASVDDLQKTGESVNNSVPLAGGGYLAGLGVYHDIHCLRRLRLFLHSDYYYDNLTEANMDYLREHMGHCIESLRRSVMCNADTNIFTFTWKDAKEVRPGIWRPNPKSDQERKCVQWEALEEWVMDRHVSLHPILLKPGGEEESVLMV